MTPTRNDSAMAEETLERARAQLRARNFEAAISILDQALTAGGRDPRAKRLLAIGSLGVGDHARALVLLEALALESPRIESTSVDLAIALLVSGRTDPARVVLERVTRGACGSESAERAGASARAWACLGVAYERLGRLAAADVAFARGRCMTADDRALAREAASHLDGDEDT